MDRTTASSTAATVGTFSLLGDGACWRDGAVAKTALRVLGLCVSLPARAVIAQGGVVQLGRRAVPHLGGCQISVQNTGRIHSGDGVKVPGRRRAVQDLHGEAVVEPGSLGAVFSGS